LFPSIGPRLNVSLSKTLRKTKCAVYFSARVNIATAFVVYLATYCCKA
jgi:hypothetical protein